MRFAFFPLGAPPVSQFTTCSASEKIIVSLRAKRAIFYTSTPFNGALEFR